MGVNDMNNTCIKCKKHCKQNKHFANAQKYICTDDSDCELIQEPKENFKWFTQHLEQLSIKHNGNLKGVDFAN